MKPYKNQWTNKFGETWTFESTGEKLAGTLHSTDPLISDKLFEILFTMPIISDRCTVHTEEALFFINCIVECSKIPRESILDMYRFYRCEIISKTLIELMPEKLAEFKKYAGNHYQLKKVVEKDISAMTTMAFIEASIPYL